MTPAGYSATPLARKLGIKEGFAIYVTGEPDNYRQLLEPLPTDVTFAPVPDERTDLVHFFSTDRLELASALSDLRQRLDSKAIVWVSWPKKSAGVPTTITEDVIREVALPMGFVDIKVAAIDATWSGLKLVVRKALR